MPGLVRCGIYFTFVGFKPCSAARDTNACIRGYSGSKQISSFAAVFPTDGPTSAPRYFVLILMDEPHPSANSYGYSTGGWVGAPAAGKVIERIAPFLGVQRRPETYPFARPKEVTELAGGGR